MVFRPQGDLYVSNLHQSTEFEIQHPISSIQCITRHIEAIWKLSGSVFLDGRAVLEGSGSICEVTYRWFLFLPIFSVNKGTILWYLVFDYRFFVHHPRVFPQFCDCENKRALQTKMISKYCDRFGVNLSLKKFTESDKRCFLLDFCGEAVWFPKTGVFKVQPWPGMCNATLCNPLSTNLFHLVVCQSRPAVLSSHSQSPSSSLTTGSINIKRV